jgi:hypothetical protein
MPPGSVICLPEICRSASVSRSIKMLSVLATSLFLWLFRTCLGFLCLPALRFLMFSLLSLALITCTLSYLIVFAFSIRVSSLPLPSSLRSIPLNNGCSCFNRMITSCFPLDKLRLLSLFGLLLALLYQSVQALVCFHLSHYPHMTE